MNCIYILIDPRTDLVRYVGITNGPLVHRIRAHRSNAKCGSHKPVHCWIRKLDSLGMRPRVALVERTADRDRELEWIALFRQVGARLLNCTDGGEGMLGYSPSKEHRAKIAATLTGRPRGPHSPEHSARISAALTGKHLSEETKAKLRAANLGKKASAERRAKMSAALKGKSKSEAHRLAVAQAQRGVKRGPLSPEHRAKQSAAMLGRKRPDITAWLIANHHRRKFTADQIRYVRDCIAKGTRKGCELATEFDVTPASISAIWRRKTYGHVL